MFLSSSAREVQSLRQHLKHGAFRFSSCFNCFRLCFFGVEYKQFYFRVISIGLTVVLSLGFTQLKATVKIILIFALKVLFRSITKL